MTDNEKALHSCLSQACALLAIEARDHEENRIYNSEGQRRNIANTLRSFVVQANKLLDDAA